MLQLLSLTQYIYRKLLLYLCHNFQLRCRRNVCFYKTILIYIYGISIETFLKIIFWSILKVFLYTGRKHHHEINKASHFGHADLSNFSLRKMDRFCLPYLPKLLRYTVPPLFFFLSLFQEKEEWDYHVSHIVVFM